MVHSKSVINTVYNVVIVVCFYTTAFCLLMDTYVHRHDIIYAAKRFRMFNAFTIVTWLHITLR
jgi:hypothetical protein